MDDVVASPAAKEMPQHAESEEERRQEPALSARVQLHPRARRRRRDALNAGRLTAWPLAKREVRDVVARLGEPLCEVPVPALGSADGVRVEAVVDKADAHASRDWSKD